MFFDNGVDGVFAEQFAAPVDVDGLLFVVDFVRDFAVAAEDVIGADVNHFRADFAGGFRNPTRAHAVYRQGEFGFRFGFVDGGVCRAVNYRFGLFVEDIIFRAGFGRQFEFLKRRGNEFDAAFSQLLCEVVTELSENSCY